MKSGARSEAGLNLLELLVVLAITALLLVLTPPWIAEVLAGIKARSAEGLLVAMIQSARAHALHRDQIITLCPLENGRCSSDWNQPLVYFIDTNGNRSLDADEEILRYLELPSNSGTLSWNRADRLRIFPGVATSATTGSLIYCASFRPEKFSFRILIARTGRVRVQRQIQTCGVNHSVSYLKFLAPTPAIYYRELPAHRNPVANPTALSESAAWVVSRFEDEKTERFYLAGSHADGGDRTDCHGHWHPLDEQLD
jgi:type IV fimbrial biogenesis protein FimT